MKKIFTLMAVAFLAANVFADVTSGNKVYFHTPWDWSTTDAVITACFSGSGSEVFSGMATSIGNNYYYVVVPGTDATFSHVTFLRLQDGSSLNWGNTIWNRSPYWVTANTGNNVYNITNSENNDSADGNWGTFLAFDGGYNPYVRIAHQGQDFTSQTATSWFSSSHDCGTTAYIMLGGGAKPNIAPDGLTIKMRYKVLNSELPYESETQEIDLEKQGDGAFKLDADENLDNVISHVSSEIISNITYGIQFWYEIEYAGIVTYYKNGTANFLMHFTVPVLSKKSSTNTYIYNGANANVSSEKWYESSSTTLDFGTNPTIQLGGEIQLSNYLTTSDVNANLNYKIIKEDVDVVAPQSIAIPYKENDKWQSTVGTIISLPAADGTYTLEYWFSAQVNNVSDWIYDSLGDGNNYKIAFVIDKATAASNIITTDQQAKSTDFYTVNGQKVTENYKGVVIKKTTYTNGQVKAEKVLK